MADIAKLISALIDREGGYTNHPSDKGGPTNFGITLAVARAFGYAGPMQALPRSTAISIYTQRYWSGPGFDMVALRSAELAEELFDTGVNMGPAVASTFLQRALNLLNQRGADYQDLTPDGRLGPMTLYALDRLIAKRGQQAKIVLRRLVDSYQACRYSEIAERNPSQEDFMYGWVANRCGVAGD